MSGKTFDPDAHVYHFGGRRLASVTEIIGGLGLSRNWAFLKNREFYLQRGRAVHDCINLHFQGHEIDWDFEGADEVRPRFEKFLLIAREGKLAPIVCEQPMWSEVFGYAGTTDYFGPFASHPLAIVDWKGDDAEPSHSLQVGGYRGLLAEAAQRGELDGVTVAEVLHCPAFVVPLGPGSFKAIDNLDGADVALFRSCAAVYNWKLSNLGGSQ